MSWLRDGRVGLQWMILKWLGRGPFLKVVLLALAIALVTGCGSGSGTTATSATPNSSPTVTTISPNAATAGGLAFTLNVHGSNFVQGSQVQWNGNSRTTTFVSSSQLQAAIMSADLATAGSITVTVLNPAPGGGTSSGATFTVAVNKIAFASGRALDGSNAVGSTQNVWVMNPDGSSQAALTKFVTAVNESPVWSHDSSKIAFISNRALDGSDLENTNDVLNIWRMNADGSGVTPLTKLTVSGVTTNSPAWSPDGTKVAFVSNRALDGSDATNDNSTPNIWVMNADGSGAFPLTDLSQSFSEGPAWSPDGSKIAYISGRALSGLNANNTNQTRNVWIVNADGSGITPLQGSGSTPVTKLTALNSDTLNFAWSPDGRKIAFSSARALDGSDFTSNNTVENIWVANADGSSPTPLTKLTALGASSGSPVWSPDGSKIVLISLRALDGSNASNTNDTENVWVVNADGSGATALTKLTVANVFNIDTVWSPDGSKIFFISSRTLDGSNAANTNGTLNIWVVNADGSSATPLTKLTAVGTSTETLNLP